MDAAVACANGREAPNYLGCNCSRCLGGCAILNPVSVSRKGGVGLRSCVSIYPGEDECVGRTQSCRQCGTNRCRAAVFIRSRHSLCRAQTQNVHSTGRLRGLVLLLSVLLGNDVLAQSAKDWPRWDEWKAACDRLPANQALLKGAPLAAPDLLPLRRFVEFESVLDAFLALAVQGPLRNASNWVGTPPDLDAFSDLNRSPVTRPALPFQPFAQRLSVPPGSSVLLQGDLHGDIHSLLAVLSHLHQQGWMVGFELQPSAPQLIFLGDYTDRGQYGIEVLYTLMRLKLTNPNRVHLVRGNHEDLSLVARYGFLAEAQAKFGRDLNVSKIIRLYEFLPVALYLGCGTNGVQLCHGGMEPGFDSGPLLSSSGSPRFARIGDLRQAGFLKAHPDWLKEDAKARGEAERIFKDFTPESPTTPSVLGFMWNDFTVFRKEPGFAHNPDRAFVYGDTAVGPLLLAASTPEFRICAVIRGHQHSSQSNPLMRRLVASRGLYRHWQEVVSPDATAADGQALEARVEVGSSRPVPFGSVWTLNVSPDSVYGLGCRFGFATCARLKLESRLEDWRMEPITVTVPILAK